MVRWKISHGSCSRRISISMTICDFNHNCFSFVFFPWRSLRDLMVCFSSFWECVSVLSALMVCLTLLPECALILADHLSRLIIARDHCRSSLAIDPCACILIVSVSISCGQTETIAYIFSPEHFRSLAFRSFEARLYKCVCKLWLLNRSACVCSLFWTIPTNWSCALEYPHINHSEKM